MEEIQKMLKAVLEGQEVTNARLDAANTRLDAIDVRLDKVDVRLDAIEKELKDLRAYTREIIESSVNTITTSGC